MSPSPPLDDVSLRTKNGGSAVIRSVLLLAAFSISIGLSTNKLVDYSTLTTASITDVLRNATKTSRAAAVIAITRTGSDVQLKNCGQTWEAYYDALPQAPDIVDQEPPLVQWTVSGGDEYRDNAGTILSRWSVLGLDPVLVVALDNETAQVICSQGRHAVFWSSPKLSYSRVADAKFTVAGALAEKGYRGFFMEMDVFCNQNPVPTFLNYAPDYDLVNIGHGNMGFVVNIGAYMVSTQMGPFFAALVDLLKHSLKQKEFQYYDNSTRDFFDQYFYDECLPLESKINNDDDWDAFEQQQIFIDGAHERDIAAPCHEIRDFPHKIVPHHLISCLEPPVVYDSTICIHPLMGRPFSPFFFKLGVAKFLGFDPQPIRADEKLLKLLSGDLEYASCFALAPHDDEPRQRVPFSEDLRTSAGWHITAMVEIAERTGRTLVFPKYLRSKDATAVPLHALVNVRSLQVPYRVMQREEARAYQDVTRVITGAKSFDKTMNRINGTDHAKVLAIDKICHLKDFENKDLASRYDKLKWCGDAQLEYLIGSGGYLDFCREGEQGDY